jgi:uncharacterized glyoxalase superfamily metalloenzyme YdcJ
MTGPTGKIPPEIIRSEFCDLLSISYLKTPGYEKLLECVAAVSASPRPITPSHGAIRLGTAEELANIRHAFAVMGMLPVGYYDLAAAGLPVHSTAFRAVDPETLVSSPFRMFVSLLRLDLIAEATVRVEAAQILARRQIFSDRLLNLIDRFETEDGLDAAEASAFITEMLDLFRWDGEALVNSATCDHLLAAHPLLADIAAFRGPHLNHLTPRTTDIDAVQAEMRRRGMRAKAQIEGPPRRNVPILLRQTSYAAQGEPVVFADGKPGTHNARFGEVEQRGAALTPKGRALYDRILAEAENDPAAFTHFPDALEDLRREGLIYLHYSLVDAGQPVSPGTDLDSLVASGLVTAKPILYEDFLPVSAAGIFRSNLGGAPRSSLTASSAQGEFEQALGAPVLDMFGLYAAIEAASIQGISRDLGLGADWAGQY